MLLPHSESMNLSTLGLGTNNQSGNHGHSNAQQKAPVERDIFNGHGR